MLYSLHLAGLLSTALVSLAVAGWVRRQTRDRAGTAMIVLLLAHAAMAAFASAEMLSSTSAGTILWNRLWYSIGLVIPVVWLLLAISYTGREYWLSKPAWGALLASPLVPCALWLTDSYHGLMVAEYRFETEPFQYVQPIYTDAGMMVTGLINVYTIFGFGLFLRMFLFSRRNARWQAVAILAGMASIFLSTAISGTDLVPAPGFPYGLYGSGVFGVVVALALFRTKLFAVSPMARDAIFESLDDAILFVDANRSIVDFNETASDFFPDLERRIGDRLDDAYPALVSPEGGPAADGGGAEAIIEMIEGTHESSFAGAVRITASEGMRTLRISASEITSGGEPRGYALIMRDVSELERYTAELEHKTDQLERFASVLSHDLRNPVAVATGYAERVQETNDVGHVREVLVALERIDETIENLLTLSREGESIDDPEFVSIRAVAGDAWATSDTGETTFENELDPEYLIRADAARLRTLFENLFRNVPDHGGETVRAGPLETGTGFFVADDGPGIPEDERGRVLDYGYSSTSEGTGLGLAIVSSIVDAHGWSLSLTESDDGGAQFEVSRAHRIRRTETARAKRDDGAGSRVGSRSPQS